jgi:hypothetical protein
LEEGIDSAEFDYCRFDYFFSTAESNYQQLVFRDRKKRSNLEQYIMLSMTNFTFTHVAALQVTLSLFLRSRK